jgi:uncharacterized protein
MRDTKLPSRRTALKSLALGGAWFSAFGVTRATTLPAAATSARPPRSSASARREIFDRVMKAPLSDTHEHLVEEKVRLQGPPGRMLPCDDWALLFSHYLNSDLSVAGMPGADLESFLSSKLDPFQKWKLLAPYWLAVKNTGYAQAVRIAISQLYGVDDLSTKSIAKVQAGYEKTRQPGFYHHILRDVGRIDVCHVNCITGQPFGQTDMPDLLKQDISIVGMFSGPGLNSYGKPTGIEVTSLADWHRVIDWWFDRYGKEAVAVKSQNAYARDIDYARIPAERAEPVFTRVLRKEPVTAEDRKALEDHLFWRAVDKATECGLPVKIHTGYYAGENSMPLGRLRQNAGSASDLCRLAPKTRFVFMHLCYPYYEEMLALTKHYTNAYIDMCWSWLVNPLAAKDYFKKHIVTAPANKLLPFGGDYIPVEPVIGHALLARRGIAQALGELVDEGWLKFADAVELIEPIMNGNARRIFPARS